MSKWAARYISLLREGKPVTFRPRGNSMTPLIRSGEEVTVEPVEISQLKKGDIVLCSVHGNHYLHKVLAVQGRRILIGNNHGRINGWTSEVYGKKTSGQRRDDND